NIIYSLSLHDALPIFIRGYLSGHAWREYQAGKRELCGEPLPEGLSENDKLLEPIITPSTKAHVGHDEDISASEIVERGIVSQSRSEEHTSELQSRENL